MLMWWRSAVNLSFFLSLATFRMRSSAWDTLARLCARCVLCWSAFPLVPALRSTSSAAAGPSTDCSAVGGSALFAGFAANMAESDFPRPCIIGYGSPHLPDADQSAHGLWSDVGSPSFRRDPFARDVL